VKLAVYDMAGKEVGSYEIDPAELAPTINRQLLHDAVVMYQANLRQGTFRTKTRGEVAGSTKKLYRQKGTGNARAGARRSGTRRGGGWRMPRKALQAATRMALAARLVDGEVCLVEGLSFEAPKTSQMAGVLTALGLGQKTVLVSAESHCENLWKSARNIEGVSVRPVADLNAHAILSPKKIVMTTAAIDAFRKTVAARATGASGVAASDAGAVDQAGESQE
jgi:large subunit ribosomal protein L4